MQIETGKVIYRYTIRNKRLYIHEGVVNECGVRKFVNFWDGYPHARCPRVEELEVVRSNGPTLWLAERDDGKARRLFVQFEEDKLVGLREQIRVKEEIVEMLKGELA